MPFNPDDFAPKTTGFNPDEFLPKQQASGFNPDEFLPKEQAFNPDGFLPVTQNDFKESLASIRDAVIGAVREQVQTILPPASTPSPLVYEPGVDPLAGMKSMGQAAQIKGAGLEISPEQNKALEDFTVENFKGIVLYPAAITGAAQAVGWYVANRTLPGAVRSAREAVTRALKANGVPEAQASRMADEGMTQAVAKAQATGAEPGIPDFVALRKAAQRGITPKEGTPNVPATAEPVAQPTAPIETPLFPVEAKAPEAAPAPAKRLTDSDMRLEQLEGQIETAKTGLTERPTAPVEGWKSEPVQGGGTSLESPSGYRVFVPEGQDPAKAAAAIREIERAEYGASQIPDESLPIRQKKPFQRRTPEEKAANYAAAVKIIKDAYGPKEVNAQPIETPLFESTKGVEYAQKTGAQVEGAGQEVAPVERPGAGLSVRGAQEGGVEAGKREIRPEASPILKEPPPLPPREQWAKHQFNAEKSWGTFNPWYNANPFKNSDGSLGPDASRWEMRQVLGAKPAYLHQRDIPVSEVRRFAKNNNLPIGKDSEGNWIVAKDKESLRAVVNAKNGHDLGIALGYVDAPPPSSPPSKIYMSDEDWVAKFRKDLASAKPEVELQNLMYSEERSKRFAAATSAYALAGGGKNGAIAALGQLKGALERRAFESLTKTIDQEGVDRLTRIIFGSPNLKTMGDRISAFQGFEKIMEGKLPQEAQIAKLQRVFGKELADEIIKKQPALRRAYDLGLQIVNMPRSLMASMDLSAPFRQGVFFVSRPQFWGKAWPDMIKSLKSEADFKALQEAIENDPDYAMLKEKGLDLTGMSTVQGEREEDFAAPIVERALKLWGVNVNVPGRLIRASGRAYVGFLNKLRLDVAKSLLKSAQDSGFKPTEDLVEKIVKYVNAGTGRGGLGPLQGAATALNAVFFSPRLMASRVNLLTKLAQPSFYEKNNAFIRRQYLRDSLALLSLGSTVMGIAKLAGADVGLDPRSSDFGKIKIGNTRLDVWGGFQQYARMFGQLVAGEYVSSITGKVMTLGEGYKPLTRKDILQRQVESKLSPTASFINALMKQQDWEGKPVSAKKEALDRMKPLAMSDLATVAKESPELLPISALGLLGFGVQTYGEQAPVNYQKMSQSMSFQDIAKTLEITEDPKARTQLFQAAIKKFPGAIRKAEDKEEVKKIRAKMVEEYRSKR